MAAVRHVLKRYKMSVSVRVDTLHDSLSEDDMGESPGKSGASADGESDAADILDDLQKRRKRYLKTKERGKRFNHSIDFKLQVLDTLQRGAKVKDVSAKFNIPSSTLSDWRRSEPRLRALARSGRDIMRGHRDRLSNYPQLDETLLRWFANQRECYPDAVLQTEVILQCAKQ